MNVVFESSFSKTLVSSTLPQGISVLQQQAPICLLPLLGSPERLDGGGEWGWGPSGPKQPDATGGAADVWTGL